jgi:phenylalanine-4-hydroxylase
VLDDFARTLSWRRGGAHGLDVAVRARTVVHLDLADGREVTGRVAARVPAVGEAALAVLDGPILLSRGRVASGRPFAGGAVVALGDASLPDRGAFDVALASGLRLSGVAVGGGEVLRLRAAFRGAPLDLPPWTILAVAPAIPSVAGGPADPGAWDRWFGELSSFASGDGEARARARRAAALPPRLGALYAEVRGMRERGAVERDRLLAIRDAAAEFEGDWLLRTEVDELIPRPPAVGREAERGTPSQLGTDR